MVIKGQFLERPTLIPVGEHVLEGLSHRGPHRPGLLIVPPHPSRGGSMDSPICAEVAFAASQAGFPTLRFNFRGVGASQGALGGLPECVEDTKAALELLQHNIADQRVMALGYDFGAEAVIALARSGVPLAGIVLVAPVSKSGFDFTTLADVTTPGLVVLGENDPLSDRLFFAEHCQRTGDLLEVIEEADHVFATGLPALGKKVVEFLASGGGPILGGAGPDLELDES